MGCCSASMARQDAQADGENQSTLADNNTDAPNGPGMNTPRGNGPSIPEGLHAEPGEHPSWNGIPANRRPVSTPAPKVHNTKTVRSVVNLKKHSLKVLKNEEFEEGMYQIQFVADSSVPCRALVYLMAYEKDHSRKEAPPRIKSRHTQFEPSMSAELSGLDQLYTSPADVALPLGFLTVGGLSPLPPILLPSDQTSPFKTPQSEELGKPPNKAELTFPLVIRLQPMESEESPSVKQAQTTFATLAKQADGSVAVQVAKQLLWVEGTSYVLHEIFGVDAGLSSGTGQDPSARSGSTGGAEGGGAGAEASGGAGAGAGAGDGDGGGVGVGKECVVCLSEGRNTLVLPCRHLCLCTDCARALRYQSANKCPICRASVKSFLQIKHREDGEPSKSTTTSSLHSSPAPPPETPKDPQENSSSVPAGPLITSLPSPHLT